jgi:DNA mismatch repair protein MutS
MPTGPLKTRSCAAIAAKTSRACPTCCACGRLSLGKAGPRDLAAVRDGLQRTNALAARLLSVADLPPGLRSVARDLRTAGEGNCGELLHTLRRALVPRPPATVGELSFVAERFSSWVDKGRANVQRASEVIEELQARYIGDIGVKSLRIRVN